MMNKYIRTAFLSNEAKAFLVIKPLYCSIGHSDNLLSKDSNSFKLQVATFDKWVFLQKETGPSTKPSLLSDGRDFKLLLIKVKLFKIYLWKMPFARNLQLLDVCCLFG
jgi:hypothetical protein